VTNLELLRELRKPGRIWMPVVGKHDVTHIEIKKADLIDRLKELDPDSDAPWRFYGDDQGAVDRWLDVQD
jgi:hypothetical protein